MNKLAHPSIAVSLLIASMTGTTAFAQQTSADSRLRDQLRQTTLELRQAQDDNADLKVKLETATRQLTDRPAAAPAAKAPVDTKSEAEAVRRALRGKASETASLQQQLAETKLTLTQSQQSYQQAITLARSRDADAKKSESQIGALDSRFNRCEDDNAKLVATSNELLERYRNKGAWAALRSEEPLTGIPQIEFEKISQTYHDRIVNATSPPPATPADAAPPKP